MSMVDRVCRCGTHFKARNADVKRGWGKFCSKRCKAVEQEARTDGQYRKMMERREEDSIYDGGFGFDIGHPMESGILGHGQE